MDTNQATQPTSREEAFVNALVSRIERDKGFAARLRRADNPDTEYQSWEFLAGFGIDLERDGERLPYALVAATLAKAKKPKNGSLRLGQAIGLSYQDKGTKTAAADKADQAKARLRRILACDDLPDLCRNLRPILTLIDSRVDKPLDYVRLLQQLRRFNFDQQKMKVKAQWAQEFYGHSHDDEEEA